MNTKNISLSIGNLAKKAEVGVETIRFYERKGLLKQPSRRIGGYRHYSQIDLQRVLFIRRAQNLGFSLKEIKDLLSLELNPRTTCGDIKKRADLKLKEIEEKIKDLQKMYENLSTLSKACARGKKAAQECRILNCFDSECEC